MQKSKELSRMRELADALSIAAEAYYNEDREIMPNIEYDKLYDELEALEKKAGVTLAGSPTSRVGYKVNSELAKEQHAAPMLSLDKTKSMAELADWLKDKKGLLSWKLDGLTVALTYRGGELARAVTRGDGLVGEVVTDNAHAFDNIPIKIAYDGELVLRGEAIIRYSDFERINAEIEDDDAKYKNPRNLSSGSVRQLDSSITAKRHVRFYAFALVSIDPAPDFKNSRAAQLNFLADLGFEVVEYHEVTAANITDEIHGFATAIEHSDLPSDGLVLIYDDIAYGDSLGSTAKFPRDGIAFKWADELAETNLIDIEWSTSRTGLINPVAVFNPVEIEGSTVSRASVHNVSIVRELALGRGDLITVYKANMIIPQIAENLTKSDTAIIPEICPVCGSPARVHDSGGVETLYCTNIDCAARQIKAFTHFVSRNALNIEGLSEKALEKFIGASFIREFADIFKLATYKDAIVAMEGFGEQSYENLIKAIDAARVVRTVNLLYALGIPTIGSANAKLICRAFDHDWQRIEAATELELTTIDGIGDVMAESYTQWFSDEKNKQKLTHILEEISFDKNETGGVDASFAGLTFVITGSLVTFPNRDALKDLIESNGGKVTGSVSEKTDYLINNDIESSSSKNKKAKELGIPIITEQDFNEMMSAEITDPS